MQEVIASRTGAHAEDFWDLEKILERESQRGGFYQIGSGCWRSGRPEARQGPARRLRCRWLAPGRGDPDPDRGGEGGEWGEGRDR